MRGRECREKTREEDYRAATHNRVTRKDDFYSRRQSNDRLIYGGCEALIKKEIGRDVPLLTIATRRDAEIGGVRRRVREKWGKARQGEILVIAVNSSMARFDSTSARLRTPTASRFREIDDLHPLRPRIIDRERGVNVVRHARNVDQRS